MTIKRLLILLIAAIFFLDSKCEEDDLPPNPLDQLPPPTQTGEQTFGCLIDGKVFIPPRFGQNSPRAFYQFVDDSYTLGISGSSQVDESMITVNMGGIDVPQITSSTYPLVEFQSRQFFAELFIGETLENFQTTLDMPGSLIITNFDTENFIISGRFEFTVISNDGNEIQITDGRFDLNYTN